MKGKKRTILYIIFFGLSASASYLQRDSFGSVILSLAFIYYLMKYIKKYR